MTEPSTSADAFVARLRGVAEARYHHRHPFNVLMHAGALTPEQLRTWVHNRYYYQTRIPIKDALILAKSADPAFRRLWLRRIVDHDGAAPGEGGLESWLVLAEAVGLSRERVLTHADVLPGVRRACDAYVELVRRSELVVAVASSLTEQLAGGLMQQRLSAWLECYPWVEPDGLRYFRERIGRAPRDAAEALQFVTENATTPELQQACADALAEKCDILWQLLDAVYLDGIVDHRPRLAPRARLHWDAARQQHVLLYPEKALVLNGTAAAIAERCTGERSVREILTDLGREYTSRRPLEIELEACSFLGELQTRALLEFRVS